MPQQLIAGPGLTLPPPQALYPANVYNSPFTAPGNQVSLGPGKTLMIPAGTWVVMWGAHTVPQWKNPVSGEWTELAAAAAGGSMELLSDGFNFRIANVTDTAIGGIVTAAGSGYAQATTTVVPDSGNSTWQPVIGGAGGSFTIVSGGSGYTMPPTVFIAAPPYPGVQMTATAALTSGAVSSISIGQAGAGYLSPPSVVIVADPTDPNLGAIVNATATVALTGAGTLTALLLINFGEPLTTAPNLTVAGSGSSATATTNPATVTAAGTDIITLQPR